MLTDALRRQTLHDGSARDASAAGDPGAARESAWRGEAGQLGLVLDGAELDAMVAEAARWAERISLCVTAPHSQGGRLPFWGELLARSPKCDRVHVRRPEHAERWLLHRLHDSGALRLVDGGGKQVASNLLMFFRGRELRVVLSHIALERAALGAAFGTLLSFHGQDDDALARACAAQESAWAKHGRIPSGSEVDGLVPAARRPALRRSEPPAPRVVTDAGELATRLEAFAAALAAEQSAAGVEPAASASVRELSGSYRVLVEPRDRSRAPFVLTLHAGSDWAAGNALLVDGSDGSTALVWRGGLLGASRSRNDLLWSEAALHALHIEDAGLGLTQRVALVAHTGGALLPQLAAFSDEMARLCELFAVEPPPVLGHALSDFAQLPGKKQTLFLYKALLGLGALEPGEAARVAAEVLRDQGYLRGRDVAPGSPAHAEIAALLERAAAAGAGFDRPSESTLRAIQRDADAYTLDDWLECLLAAWPEQGVVPYRTALRLAFERAEAFWGLSGERLQPSGKLERRLEEAVACALRRGLLARAGAEGLCRGRASSGAGRPSESPAQGSAPLPGPVRTPASSRAPEAAREGFVRGFWRALERLPQIERLILGRRSGWYGRREPLDSVAQRLGLTPERAQQLESDAWRRVESESGWLSVLRQRLERGLGGSRAISVQRLARDDAWWRGVERQLGLADAALEVALDGVYRVELDAPPRRESFFARFTPAELDRAVEALLEGAAQIPTPTALDAYLPLCRAACEGLDDGLLEPLRAALEARLDFDTETPGRVLAFHARKPAPLETLPSDKGAGSEALLRLEDVLRSVFRSAGTPLTFDGVAERVRKRLDVSDALLAQRLVQAPFVRRNADQYGLLGRDVPGGPDAIAAALNAVTEALAASERALGAEAAATLVQARASQPWSSDLIGSLLASDPALSLSAAHEVTLRRWEHARLPGAELICPAVPATLRARFAKGLQAPPGPTDKLVQRLRSELDRLERSSDTDDYAAVPLARSLADVLERLLQQTADTPEAARLAQAAAAVFLDAIAPDEDDLDAAPVDGDALSAAGEALAAVLRWLRLDWLEGLA